MIRNLMRWMDDRTGYQQLVREALYENIPGGSRWRYVTGSMLTFCFVTQIITGLFLWTAYSPSSYSAYESVHYIQYEMQGGATLRGVHHFMSTAMVILLGLHFLQVVIDGAYKAPREVNFWLGLIAMMIVMGLALTGYLLPWDQKGYWATNVATNLMTLAPLGDKAQQLVVGGSEYGHHTLTRFFALHAGILPGLLVLTLAAHVALFRKHGITAKITAGRPDEYFWPKQVFKDAIACLVVLGLVLLLVMVDEGELSAPADPSESYAAARPEWYFLFLFELLKYFEGPREFVGAILIPGMVVGMLFLMPILGRWRWGHRFNVGFLLVLIGGASLLTFSAWHADNYAAVHTLDPEKYADDPQARAAYRAPFAASQSFLDAQDEAHHNAERINRLIELYGIPKEGAITLLREDPATQGPKLFKQYCASCHSHIDEEGHGVPGPNPPEDEQGNPIANPGPYGAPNLFGFASREWLAGLLDPQRIDQAHYFGNTAHADGQMSEFVNSTLADLDDDGQDNLQAVIVALSAEADLPSQRELDAAARDDDTVAAGQAAMGFDGFSCVDCHTYGEEESGAAPDLNGYGSGEWLRGMISAPEHPSYYGYEDDANDRMPAFAASQTDPLQNILSPEQLDLLVRWLRGDDSLHRPLR